MPRPAAAKLSLVDRKDIRDEWEANKARYEAAISDILDESWTIEVDPLVIAPYNEDRPGQLGSIINGYFEPMAGNLKQFVSNSGDIARDALNRVAHKHVITMTVDEDCQYSYCGPEIHDGRLVIAIKAGALWTNVDDSVAPDAMMKAIDQAESSSSSAPVLSTVAQSGIANDFQPQIDEIQNTIRDILQIPDLKLNPNFEALATALSASSDATEDWQQRMGLLAREYFDAIPSNLRSEKFDSDDMLREAFAEVVTKNEIALRIVDELTTGRSTYAEGIVEDGVLYLQFTPARFGTNVGDASMSLVDVISDAE